MEFSARAKSCAPRILTAAFALTLFFIVAGAKWALVDRFGSDIPNWDQWDAEGLNLLVPWFEHDHFIAHLFHPHNEHQVVLTKLQNLGLALLSGQWDARLQCVTNAAVHAALAVALWLVGRRWLANRWDAPLFVFVAALFGLPLAWQNTLGGFHSQQYWLLALSFVAMVVLPFTPPWRVGWWAATAAATLALVTMGSGFVASAAVLGLVGFRVLRRETTLRVAWPTLALTSVLVVIGMLTRVEVEYHQALKAKTAHDFFLSILHSLQWPAPSGYDWLAALLWLPWFLTAWRVMRPRNPDTSPVPGPLVERGGQTIVLLGGWVLVQIVATAYARGVGAFFPASRYMDTLGFGATVNALALGWLLSQSQPLFPWKYLRSAFALLWLGVLTAGLWNLLHRNLSSELPDEKRYYGQAEAHVRGFLATEDPAQLEFDDIPYPGGGNLRQRLSHLCLRQLMPVSVRPPIPSRPARSVGGTFLENNASQLHIDTAPRYGLSPSCAVLASLPTWGSFATTGTAATGEWTSAPITTSLDGWLMFQTAGHIGEPGIALELHDAQTGALLADVRPTKIPGDTWRAAYVRAPRTPFVVVARDQDSHRWFAFSAPVEMSSLSHVAWQTAKNGLLIVYIAASMAALLGLGTLAFGSAAARTNEPRAG